jgi:hypothetical protein
VRRRASGRSGTWIIRAVYQEFSNSLSFPVRASDGFDAEDLDSFAVDIAERTGRSLKNTEANPMFGRVRTVHDLIMFLHHQPALERSRLLEETQPAAAARRPARLSGDPSGLGSTGRRAR